MKEREFLGKGMKFPPQINPATGRFVVSSEEESVKESLYLILMTHKTERFVRPDFGSDLMAYTFMDINLTSVSILERRIKEEIIMQEPRIEDVSVTTDAVTKSGCLIIEIHYTVINTNVRDNLVFPFYLDAMSEDEEDEQEYEYAEYESAKEQEELLER